MFSSWHTVRSTEKDIEAVNKCVLVAEKDSEIVGVCIVKYLKSRKDLNIAKLHIKPSFQGMGVGKELTNRVSKCFSPVKKLTLEVEVNNSNAIEFYKKLGFECVGEVSYSIGNLAMACLKMEKVL